MNSLYLKPIGVVRVDCSDDEVREKTGQIEGRIEVFKEYEEALDGIEEYSHLFIIAFMHKAASGEVVLKVKPKKLLKKGLKPEEVPTLGVFATDSPTRPNPLGLTLVKLKRREGTTLYVYGLDLFDGTPVLDIKPYRQDYVCLNFKRPSWVMLHDEQKAL